MNRFGLGFEGLPVRSTTFRIRLTGLRLNTQEEADQSYQCATLLAVDAPPRSVYDAARAEAEKHKWIESQKHGCDLGDLALKDWFRTHWLPFCRSKRLEHVEGQQRWDEFAAHEFGQVSQLIVDGDLLLDRILDRMEHGYDNLEIINWALAWGLVMDRVIDLLMMIDINRARLEPLMD
jgi:hypothetical protein